MSEIHCSTHLNVMYYHPVNQNSRKDFSTVRKWLQGRIPFTFIRFSDGEMEIIRNQPLKIGKGVISWRKGEFTNRYPVYDEKEFNPTKDVALRDELIQAAKYRHSHFLKGIPASHNGALSDRNLMIELNGNSIANLTFSDLFLNQNFLKFRNQIVPIFMGFDNVFVLGNFRMKPVLLNRKWRLIPIPDNAFPKFDQVIKDTMDELSIVPRNSLVLASASSLSNIIGKRLYEIRKDITFFDVGTSMHDLMGLDLGIREYHWVLMPNNRTGIKAKINLLRRRSFWLKW